MVSPVLSSSTGAVKACSVESDSASFSVCSALWLLFSGSSGGFARLRRVIGIGACSLREVVCICVHTYWLRKEHYITVRLEKKVYSLPVCLFACVQGSSSSLVIW